MRKIAVGLVAALAGGTMLMSGGSAVAATTTKAPKVEILDVSPNPVVVKHGSETVARFKVGASSDVEKVELSVEPADSKFRTLRGKEVKPLENWRFSVPFTSHDPEGKWKAIATAFDKEGKRVAHDTSFFYVDVRKGWSKADTRLSFDASPSKVRKGKPVYFSGRLLAERGDHWRAVRYEKVHVYYKANRFSGWKWVASDRTDRHGKFYAKDRAYRSGSYKAVFKGDRKLDDATSRTDYVRVYSWRR
ncbi:hypothetical protein [Nonomuraea harbinensis]|uniref:Uncharacterized protein n=1 Tax=Nonomuraea harbinensis TaxID=1286938 RepID=A0ABW1C8C2_9ACTN|nr:hypothetical protein [Nonomuraea harbinensis]